MKTEIFDIMLVLFLPILIVFIIYVRSMSQSKYKLITDWERKFDLMWTMNKEYCEVERKKKDYFIIMGAEKAGLTHAQEIQIRKHLENMYKIKAYE